MGQADCAGVILAGGRSQRMGGKTKALIDLAGKPMLQHVIDRVEPQVSRLLLSLESAHEDYAAFGLQQVPDPAPGHGGPLGGLLAAMQEMAGGAQNWLLLAACDAPFLPLGLARRLQESAETAGTPGAVVRLEGEVQPTFSVWHRSLLPVLQRAVNQQRMAGFKQFLDQAPLALLDWPASEGWRFFNINDEAALQRAQRMVQQEGETCSA